VGSIAARLLPEFGATVIAVSDSQGGICSDVGLDPEAAAAFKAEHGTVVGLPGTQTITNEDLLELECDVLIPATIQSQIHAANADRLQTRLICEAANGPTTPRADDILFRRGIPVLPDILANAGGVTVSYFEWVQNIENEQWDEDDVNAKLKVKMRRAVDAVVARWEAMGGRDGVPDREEPLQAAPDLRTAALVLAIERVAHVALERGIWP
jgi:glutamate dehydrogenase (NAD(P)+)